MRTARKFIELLLRSIKRTVIKFNVNVSALFGSRKLPTRKLTIMQSISLAVSAAVIWVYIALDTLYCAVIDRFELTFEDLNELIDETDGH
ncbi:MAG: hypothetical protein ACTS6G_00360 [Candidatus Hodgkinia cicadicola]